MKLGDSQLKKEKNKVNRVNPLDSRPESWDGDNPIKSKLNVKGPVTQVMRPR
jgi:hypothetical protein